MICEGMYEWMVFDQNSGSDTVGPVVPDVGNDEDWLIDYLGRECWPTYRTLFDTVRSSYNI